MEGAEKAEGVSRSRAWEQREMIRIGEIKRGRREQKEENRGRGRE